MPKLKSLEKLDCENRLLLIQIKRSVRVGTHCIYSVFYHNDLLGCRYNNSRKKQGLINSDAHFFGVKKTLYLVME